MNIFIWEVVILCILYWVKTQIPYWQGRSGENFVSKKLHELDSERYKIIDDVLLPSNGNTKTTQIDHVVVSNFGIFCIETKMYSGWIFGSAHQQYWTQVIYHSKTRFYNPLRQNYAHMKAVEDLVLPLCPSIPILSFVAFPIAGKLKISGTDRVGHAVDVVNKIEAIDKQVLSDADRDNIYDIISRANIMDKNTRKKHNIEIKELKNL